MPPNPITRIKTPGSESPYPHPPQTDRWIIRSQIETVSRDFVRANRVVGFPVHLIDRTFRRTITDVCFAGSRAAGARRAWCRKRDPPDHLGGGVAVQVRCADGDDPRRQRPPHRRRRRRPSPVSGARVLAVVVTGARPANDVADGRRRRGCRTGTGPGTTERVRATATVATAPSAAAVQ